MKYLVELYWTLKPEGYGPAGGILCADLNCDLVVGLEDIVRFVNYLYSGWPLLPEN